MSTATVVNQITAATDANAPAVLAGIIGIEQAASSLPGATKAQIVVAQVLAGARAAEGIPNPTVAGIAALVDIFVSILNASGLFKKKAT